MRDLDKYEEAYRQTYGFEKYQVHYRRRKVLEFVERQSPKSVLEVGCGFESLFNFYTNFSDFHFVEPSNVFFSTAHALIGERRNIHGHHGTLEELADSLRGINFDFIIVSSLLHEVSAPERLLASIHEIAESNTFIHVNVPNARSLHTLLGVEMGVIQDVFQQSPLARELQRTNVYDLARLTYMVQKAGFEVLESGSYFIKPFTHAQMEKALIAEIIDVRVLDALYTAIKYMPEFGSEIYVNLRKSRK